MGWCQVKMELVGVRSAHNSKQDKMDLANWEFLQKTIQDHVRRYYPELKIKVSSPEEG